MKIKDTKISIYIISTFIFVYSPTIFNNLLLAQDPNTSHTFLNNSFDNPASTFFEEESNLTLNYRNQWPGLGNAFSTYKFGIGAYPIRGKSELGTTIVKESTGNGAFSFLSVNLYYTFPIKVNQYSDLVLGLQSSFVQNAIYQETLNNIPAWADNHYTEGSIGVNNSHYYPDFATFLAYRFKNFHFGAMVSHLHQPVKYNSLSNEVLNRRYQLSFQYKKAISAPYRKHNPHIRPGLFIDIQENNKTITYGSSIELPTIEPGIWLKHEIFNFNSPTIVLSSKINFLYLYAVYSFDYIFNNFNVSINKFGVHEVTLGYHLKYKGKRKTDKGTINCPY